jgi:hypothetical protein
MNNRDFEKMVRQFREQQDKLIIIKGHDYTVGNGDGDRLWNFKFVGEMLGISPLQALGVYWLKHVLSICTYIKMGKVESEGIDGRFLDESNYNLLGRALINDLFRNPFEEVFAPSNKDAGKAMSAVQKSRYATRNKASGIKRRKNGKGSNHKLQKGRV